MGAQASGSVAVLSPCDGADHQLFTLSHVEQNKIPKYSNNAIYNIGTLHTESSDHPKCLSIQGGTDNALLEGSPAAQSNCFLSELIQKWKVYYTDNFGTTNYDDRYSIIRNELSGKCLSVDEVDNTKVVLTACDPWPASPANAQLWDISIFNPPALRPVEDGARLRQLVRYFRSRDNIFTNSLDAQWYGEIVGDWDVSQVTDFRGVFKAVDDEDLGRIDEDLSNWDTRNAVTMEGMFDNCLCSIGEYISNWDVSKVTDMSMMFHELRTFNQPIGNWNVARVTRMTAMFFDNFAFNQDLSKWEVDEVTNMRRMFFQTREFNQDLSTWNVGKVTTMGGMFEGASFNGNIGNWDVANVKEMKDMLSNRVFNQDISKWNVAKVTDMDGMFGGAKSFNQNISQWDVGNVTSMRRMFGGATVFNQNLCEWGKKMGSDVAVTDMFYDSFFKPDVATSGCDVLETPDLNATPKGPFCNQCFL